MSSQGVRGSPERAPRELLRSFLGAEMELGDVQKSPPEVFESLEDDLKIKNLEFLEAIDKYLKQKIIDFSSPDG